MPNDSIRISALIVAKNEAKLIAHCLEQLSWTDEQIVIDNNSSDTTASVAREHGAHVYSCTEMNFAKLRNIAAQKAHGSWLLYIDTDEEIQEELKAEILDVITHFTPDSSPHAYTIKRQNYYLGKPWPTKDGMIRLIFKSSLKEWYGELHETAAINGSVGTLNHVLLHKTHRCLEEMVNKTNQWSDIEANLRLSAGHPPVVAWRIFRVVFTGFVHSYITQQGWKTGTVGIIESMYQGFSMFITYAKLWEKQQSASK